jgi:hypothetical protein
MKSPYFSLQRPVLEFPLATNHVTGVNKGYTRGVSPMPASHSLADDRTSFLM